MFSQAEVYTEFVKETGTLTYYYDSQRASRSGVTELYDPIGNPGANRFTGYNTKVYFAVIDPSMKNAPLTSYSRMFYGGVDSETYDFLSLSYLIKISGLENLNTAIVTDMSEMFKKCSHLSSLKLSSFNTENVTDMANMFRDCSALTSLDLCMFNTGNVTDMNGMFNGCSALTALNLSSFNTENVTKMNYMFSECSRLTSLDLSSFNTENVTNMANMFRDCSALTSLDISSFNTGKVTEMRYMFLNCSSLKTIYCDDNWSTSSAKSKEMFEGCSSLVGGNGTVFDSNVIDNTYARPDGGTSAPGYFTKNPRPKEVYTEFDESTGTLTYYYNNKREERTGPTELYDPINNLDDARFVGYNEKVVKAVIDPSMKNAPLTSFRNMFYGGMDTSLKLHRLSNMTSIEGLENLNTDDVTTMRNMFGSCYSLTTLDLSSFNTSKVTNMLGMFTSCHSLTSVDVSSFDISSVTSMWNMFQDCPALTTIYCSNDWSTSTAQTDNMFSGCKSLVGGKGTVFDSNVINATYARPDGGTSAPGYFTEKPAYMVGDANGNGEVEIGDVTSVLTLMATPEANGYNSQAADANGNGEIEIGDVTTILTIMANGGE
ncbi:MAG: BspA family leucine-rich repeat surface protein [Bacteroidaceae bacterium]|nr:BspA family leucine-rich repeat surface protein [Bacteroidaceae bacterium]